MLGRKVSDMKNMDGGVREKKIRELAERILVSWAAGATASLNGGVVSDCVFLATKMTDTEIPERRKSDA